MEGDPTEALNNLAQRFAEMVKKEFGLEVNAFAVLPNFRDPNIRPVVQAVMELDPDVAFKSSEQREMDKEFEEIARRSHAEQVQDRIEQARTGAQDTLKDLLDMDGGIGLDVTPPEPTEPDEGTDV